MPTTGELGGNPVGSPSNPVATDTGQHHAPDRDDYERKQRQEKIDREVDKVKDRQSTEYWKEKERERKHAEKLERDVAARKEREAKPAKRPGKKRKAKPGIEIPKQGMGRIGSAHHGLGRIEGDSGMSLGGGAAGYSDPFAGMSGGMRASRGSGVAFTVGGFGELMGGGMMGGGYADPFASLTPGKRGRKPKDTYASPFGGMMLAPSRGRGRPPKSIFGSRLSLEMF